MADLYETCEYCGTDAALAYSSDGNVLLCDSCRPGYDAEHVPNPIEQLNAELEILQVFDRRRELAGHDYGSGQRRMELRRRQRELEALDPHRNLITDDPTDAELAAAWERVGAPRLERVRREHYRRETPATRRTRSTWETLEALYAKGGRSR